MEWKSIWTKCIRKSDRHDVSGSLEGRRSSNINTVHRFWDMTPSGLSVSVQSEGWKADTVPPGASLGAKASPERPPKTRRFHMHARRLCVLCSPPDKTSQRVIREIRDLPLLSAITLTARNAPELPCFAWCASEKDPEIGRRTTVRCTPKNVPPTSKGASTCWPHTGPRWKEGKRDSGNSV